MSLSIGGALVANLLNARSYLEQQLTAQSADTASVPQRNSFMFFIIPAGPLS